MEENHVVQVEETTTESTPEQNQTDQPQEPETAPAEQVEETPQAPAEERPTRSQERIRETIAARKAAEAAAATASREAEYWKEQALSRTKETDSDELEGVTDEGIDPKVFAKSLKESLLKEVQKLQGATDSQKAALAEQMEVSAQPEMQDEFFRKMVLRTAAAEGLSPWEAFDSVKDEFATREKSSPSPRRDEAGKFVREQSSTPAAGRGTSSSSQYFTRGQIDSMSLSDYEKNRPEIERQLQAGRIK